MNINFDTTRGKFKKLTSQFRPSKIILDKKEVTISKKLLILFSFLIIILMWSGCKKSVEEILLPDIRGTWDFTIVWTENNCTTTQSDKGYAIVTQNELDAETTTGTIKVYNEDDENLTCAVWTFFYIMDSNGKMTINETGVSYDPQQCSDSATPDAKGDILMLLNATTSQVTGTVEFKLSSVSQNWSCIQIGSVTYSNKR